MYLASNELWITLLEAAPPSDNPKFTDSAAKKPRKGVNLRLNFVGANPNPRIESFDPLDAKVSYFIGNDSTKWKSNVPTWGGVRYVGLYPGVDLEISSEKGQWVWRFITDDPAQLVKVRLRVNGHNAMRLDNDRLRFNTLIGDLTLPLIQANGFDKAKTKIAGDEVIAPFTSASITPLALSSPSDLLYSTFLGRSNTDYAGGIAVDGSGAIYVAGQTQSADFPTTAGAFDTSLDGTNYDMFVTKLSADGSGLLYSTFIGGTGDEYANGLALDANGAAYIVGYTQSSVFPTTSGAFQTARIGNTDAFVVKLNTDGTNLDYATLLGSELSDYGYGIALDSSGSAYVVGYTSSTTFPISGTLQPVFKGNFDTFVTKLNPSGSGLVYSSYIGGSGYDAGYGIALDTGGAAYLVGSTASTDFPTSGGAFQPTHGGSTRDVFVAKVDASGSALTYSTFLGGSGTDFGMGIVVDGNSSAYVVGQTASTNFPTKSGSYRTTYGGATDVFVTKINVTGTALDYSTFLGGTGGDSYISGMAIDNTGSVYVAGVTSSTDFPTTSGVLQTVKAASSDAFVTRLQPDGSGLIYSTFLGGYSGDYPYSIAADYSGSGVAYLTGSTYSGDFPLSAGAFQTTFGGFDDVFITKLRMAGTVIATPTSTPLPATATLTFTPQPTSTPTKTVTPLPTFTSTAGTSIPTLTPTKKGGGCSPSSLSAQSIGINSPNCNQVTPTPTPTPIICTPPARVTNVIPPEFTTSLYVEPSYAQGTLREFYKNLGLDYGKKGASGLIILDFGDPIIDVFLDPPTIAVPNPKLMPHYGAKTVDAKRLYSVDIVNVVEGFMSGWREGYFELGGYEQVSDARIVVAVGTTNCGDVDCKTGKNITRQHGDAWAAIVDGIQTWLIDNHYDSRISVAAALDAEHDWGEPGITIDWVDGYTGHFTGKYQSPQSRSIPKLYNFGSCENCSSDPTVPLNVTWTPFQKQPLDRKTWNLESALYVAWSAPYNYPVPQIYSECGFNARQWTWLSRYSFDTRRGAILFAGVLTQEQACSITGDPNCNWYRVKNSPSAGWTQLYDALYISPNTRLEYILWLTDIRPQVR